MAPTNPHPPQSLSMPLCLKKNSTYTWSTPRCSIYVTCSMSTRRGSTSWEYHWRHAYSSWRWWRSGDPIMTFIRPSRSSIKEHFIILHLHSDGTALKQVFIVSGPSGPFVMLDTHSANKSTRQYVLNTNCKTFHVKKYTGLKLHYGFSRTYLL